MHEMGLVRDVVDVVLKTAESADARQVTRVCLTIGYGRDMIEDLMQGLFRYLARGTIAEGAVLEITRIPVTVRCNGCGTVFPINLHLESTWTCPCCGDRLNYVVQTGMEFMIDGIEVQSKNPARHDHDGVEPEGRVMRDEQSTSAA